jgi:hypothetical protein
VKPPMLTLKRRRRVPALSVSVRMRDDIVIMRFGTNRPTDGSYTSLVLDQETMRVAQAAVEAEDCMLHCSPEASNVIEFGTPEPTLAELARLKRIITTIGTAVFQHHSLSGASYSYDYRKVPLATWA